MPDRVLRGTPVSSGVALGPALVVQWEVPAVPERPLELGAVDAELARLGEALDWSRERLHAVRVKAAERAGPEEARIFDAS